MTTAYDTGACSLCGVDGVIVDGKCITHWCHSLDESEGVTYRWFIKEGDGPEREVTKREWVSAERRAGFVNTMGHPDEPGTGGFSTSRHGGLSGRYGRIKPRPSVAELVGSDPDFTGGLSAADYVRELRD